MFCIGFFNFLRTQKVQGALALICLIMFPFVVPLSSILSLNKYRNHPVKIFQCGVNASPGEEMCPQNMCCSRYGFCGTAKEYCGLGCQSNCIETSNSNNASPALPGSQAAQASQVSNASNTNLASPASHCPGAMTRSIAYYESWASHRACNKYMPSDIDPTPYTHINFAFALIDQNGKVELSLANDTILIDQLHNVRDKSLNRNVELWIAVGGYAVGAAPFAKLAATQQGRKTFIDSACAFMEKYGFKGMDLDWEYPTAIDSGGTIADTKNMVSLVKEYRDNCKNKGLSVTLPGGRFYMKGFDLKGLEPYIDWLNVMAYDLHGSWETPTIAQPHTNLSDIQSSLQLVWNAGISPGKVILGLADYGKTYTLSSGSCTKPGCPAAGPGLAGPCSNEAGSLHNAEINDILKKYTDIKPEIDKNAAVKYFSWDKTQWVSYDDQETWQLKKQYAADKCLAGTLEWAVDMNAIPSKGTKNNL